MNSFVFSPRLTGRPASFDDSSFLLFAVSSFCGFARSSRMTFPVAILAGGMATRLRPITEKIPKLLVEVAGEPFFSHQIRLLKAAGLTRLVLCVGYLGEQITELYGDGAKWG